MVPCILTFFAKSSFARSWNGLELIHAFSVPDYAGLVYLDEKEQLLREELSRTVGSNAPIASPTIVERMPSTTAPSPMPSASPSNVPSSSPSDAPTALPSAMPSSLPSEFPSAMPSDDPFPPSETPKNPDDWYFDYDDSSKYGPEDWGSAKSPDYWEEFDSPGYGAWRTVLAKRSLSKNVCEKGKRQSPIDLEKSGEKCGETHEVRSLPGDFQVTGERVKKLFESNKLRLLYERRPCINLNNPKCQEPDPPHADFPVRTISDFALLTVQHNLSS